MAINLRLSLTVFKLGFAAESAGGFVALASASRQLPFHGLLILVGPAFTALGILFLFLGRREWNELHRSRVRYATLAFGVTLLAIALAAAPIALLSAFGDHAGPGWLGWEFGVAVAVVFAATFVTYALVAAHLVGRLGEVAIVLGLGWSVILSAGIGLALSGQLEPIVHAISARSGSLGPIVDPITLLDALLAFSYLAFFLAFVDAHVRVARGLDPA
ncbi:MAG: hypothetical protein L3K18_02315 [Thermoplasmata archaeon]|nr:hypothetical protein [Thermoplasmata archaeon]MCI4355965.1 hypothetical protein [Thermoplasmata archaeon]